MDWRTVEKNVSLPLEMMGWDRSCAPRPRPRAARARRADGIREPPPVAALGRHAAAGRDRPGAHVQAVADPDGRAVRRARRDDARPAQPRAASHLGGDEAPPWSSSPTRSPRRCSCRPAIVVMSARPGRVQKVVDVDLALPAHERHARGHALLRARDRGAGASPRVARGEGDAVTPRPPLPRRVAAGAADPRARPRRLGARRAGVRDPEVPAAEAERDRDRVLGSAERSLAGRAGTRSPRPSGASSSASPAGSRRRSCSPGSGRSGRR